MSINTIQLIDVRDLDCADSFRVGVSFHPLVRSYRRHGLQDRPPILVSKQNGRYLVHDGCRRVRALLYLLRTDLETFKRILPSGKIYARVLQHS